MGYDSRDVETVGVRWIFGYGSLVWRPAFEHLEARPALLHGWARRFWQGSTDHRGTPEAPGRVVTLVQDPDARCVGIAYRVSSATWNEVMGALDHRERGGYERHDIELSLRFDGARVPSVVYLAGPTNPHWLGAATDDEIVAQIANASGPSGPNDEYLLRLDRALRELDADDAHVHELADRLRALRA